MLDRIKYTLEKRNAFSAAEMLLVMLIISFLILAMPPLVHKKFEKRVVRGEHGRYECWKGSNGHVYEFIATEKGGPVDRSTMVDALGRPKGRDLGLNATCRFNPQRWAQNAAFFSIQIVGGGAGGTYAPYDESITYYNPNASMNKPVRLTSDDYNLSSGSGSGYTSDTTRFSYEPYLSYYGKYNETTWVKEYFPAVLNKSSVRYCSGRGHNGPIDNVNITWGTSGKGMSIIPGGAGGAGLCYTVNPKTIAIGVNSGDYYYAQARATEDGYQASPGSYVVFISNNGDAGPYQSAYEVPLNDMSTKFIPGDTLESIMGGKVNVTAWDWGCSMGSTSYMPDVGLRKTRVCGSQQSCADCGIILDFTLHTQLYTSGGSGSKGTINYEKLIPQGVNGTKNTDGSSAIRFPSDSVLTFSGYNYDGARASLSATDIFPSNIEMSYRYSYNTPTYGYAGQPGQYKSLMLPKINGKLEIRLGDGGWAGVYHARTGLPGSDTVVWQKDWETSDSTACTKGTSGCKYILTAKGGFSTNGGVSGPKVTLLGINTCKRSGAKGRLSGCLDKGVVTRDEAEMRYAVSSGFTPIPEFDRRTKTPSAINVDYRFSPEGYTPGSGGNGGYSIITDNAGTEYVKATNHTNFTPESLAIIGEPGWVKESSWLKRINPLSPSLPAEVNNYPCDDGGHPVIIEDWKKARACEPKNGIGGAVVIVW